MLVWCELETNSCPPPVKISLLDGTYYLRGHRTMGGEPIDRNELKERLRQDGPEVLGEIWKQHEPALRKKAELLYQRYPMPAKFSVDDVLQAAYVDASRQLATYIGGGMVIEPKFWLNRIVKERMIKFWRENRTKGRSIENQSPLPADSGQVPPARDPSPSADYRASERLERYRRAYAKLSTEDQDVIRLRTYEQRSWEEVGMLLGGLTPSGASRRHDSAVARFEEILRKEEGFDSKESRNLGYD
jgi:RNA polymerase sigma factor (sigma-70 family)